MAKSQPRDLTMSVDDQMLVVLEIMMPGARSPTGEDMFAIGAWEAPIRRLFMKGYVFQIGTNAYRIADKGKEFFAQSEGTTVEALTAEAPKTPDWIVTALPEGGLVILRKNELTVSGYEAMAARWMPVTHGHMNDIDTLAVVGDSDGFLQAVLDAAWAKGLRPTHGS